ncbi:hypothetical protein CsSME_00030140 [Camellia sinensis var. sinensis]
MLAVFGTCIVDYLSPAAHFGGNVTERPSCRSSRICDSHVDMATAHVVTNQEDGAPTMTLVNRCHAVYGLMSCTLLIRCM